MVRIYKRNKKCYHLFDSTLLSEINLEFFKEILTLLITANLANISRILNHIPIFSALSATALLVSQTNFCASSLISTQLLRSANKGAKGKAATNMVMKPNWRTEIMFTVSTNVFMMRRINCEKQQLSLIGLYQFEMAASIF